MIFSGSSILLVILVSLILLPAQAWQEPSYDKPVYMYNNKGIYTGSLKKSSSNSYYETNNHGVIVKTYKKNGNVTHVYNKHGVYVGSFRK